MNIDEEKITRQQYFVTGLKLHIFHLVDFDFFKLFLFWTVCYTLIQIGIIGFEELYNIERSISWYDMLVFVIAIYILYYLAKDLSKYKFIMNIKNEIIESMFKEFKEKGEKDGNE